MLRPEINSVFVLVQSSQQSVCPVSSGSLCQMPCVAQNTCHPQGLQDCVWEEKCGPLLLCTPTFLSPSALPTSAMRYILPWCPCVNACAMVRTALSLLAMYCFVICLCRHPPSMCPPESFPRHRGHSESCAVTCPFCLASSLFHSYPVLYLKAFLLAGLLTVPISHITSQCCLSLY